MDYLLRRSLWLSAIAAKAQNPGYIYTANETLNVVDVLRASDHVVIASMPTICDAVWNRRHVKTASESTLSTYDGRNIYAFDGETNTRWSRLFNLDRSCER